jgi:hypothetical protein
MKKPLQTFRYVKDGVIEGKEIGLVLLYCKRPHVDFDVLFEK